MDSQNLLTHKMANQKRPIDIFYYNKIIRNLTGYKNVISNVDSNCVAAFDKYSIDILFHFTKLTNMG